MMTESEDKSNKKYQHGKVFKKRFNFKDHYILRIIYYLMYQ
jgi:hypothetical protein